MTQYVEKKVHLVVFVLRMAVMCFVRATCSRGGSVCKDWFDRAGLMQYYATRNVLNVGDFVWAKEGMELIMPDGSHETDPLRGQVRLNRVKHHYHEAGYEYEMSVTADAVQVGRRANTWLFVLQFCRGLFRVQYAGMSEEAIELALRDRAENGYVGGMPPGATITAEEAVSRWEAGERAYLLTLESEPFFVQPRGRRDRNGGAGEFVFSSEEMRTEWFGAVFSEIGDELGFRPHASGLNSMRRHTMVGIQKGAEKAGMDPAMHAKKASQHRGDGHSCREKVYEDSTATTDILAFLMGREPQRIENLRSLAMTRVKELTKFRKFSDVAKDDPIRVELLDQNEQRLKVEKALEEYEKILKKAKDKSQIKKSRVKITELGSELGIITRRLQALVLEQKRQKVYADGQRELADETEASFRARTVIADLSSLTRTEIIVKYAVGPTRRVLSRVSRRTGATMAADGVATLEPGLATADRESRMHERRRLRARFLGQEFDEAAQDESEATTIVETSVQVGAAALMAVQVTVSSSERSRDAVGDEDQGVADEAAVSPGPQSVEVAPTTVEMAPVGRREQKRRREDELLVRYELLLGTCANARMSLAESEGVPVGTLDGILARVRARRRDA